MIFHDYHIHSLFSSDSSEKLESIIQTAKHLQMAEICLTDHYDMDFPTDAVENPAMDFSLDMDAYVSALKALKQKEADGINIKIGVELGVMESTANRLNQFVADHSELDFVISSIHIVDNMDPYYPAYFEGKTEIEGYRRYFELILNCAKEFKSYSVLGHLDYILRYGPTKADHFSLGDYYDIFDELFKMIIPEGKGIEINTGSLYKNMRYPHPHPEILKLYKERGGEIITVGSDAHFADKVGYGFDAARNMLIQYGFKYYCTFQDRKPVFHKIW